MCSSVGIDLGAPAGVVTAMFDDNDLARSVATVFGAEAHLLARPVGNDRSPMVHVHGNAVVGYSLDDDSAAYDAAAAVGLLDLALDKHIRSCALRTLFTVHASAVEMNGSAVVIVGTSGVGKTTLGMACACAGMPHVGDEFGFLDLADGSYFHARYPLCVRAATWEVLALKSPCGALPMTTPWGGKAHMCASASVAGVSLWEGAKLPLGSIIVPQRIRGALPRLSRLSVASWPDALMPSLDAPVSRDAMFRELVHFLGSGKIPVLLAEYDTPAEGVALVRQVGVLTSKPC